MQRLGRLGTQADAADRAPRTVKKVKTECDHRDDVEKRDPPDAEAGDHVRVHILVTENTRRSNGSSGEMENVEDDEQEQQGATPSHRPRGNRRGLGIAFYVSNRARSATLPSELNGGNDMQGHRDDEHR